SFGFLPTDASWPRVCRNPSGPPVVGTTDVQTKMPNLAEQHESGDRVQVCRPDDALSPVPSQIGCAMRRSCIRPLTQRLAVDEDSELVTAPSLAAAIEIEESDLLIGHMGIPAPRVPMTESGRQVDASLIYLFP